MNWNNDYPPLFDSHCHLDFADFDQDRPQVLNRAVDSGVGYICIPATRREQWPSLVNPTSVSHSVQIVVALGLHPYFMADHHISDVEELDQLLQQQHSSARVVAIGETGLDFVACADREEQLSIFTGQVKLACRHELPLIIHGRKSHDQILQILRRHRPPCGGIIHAYSGSEQQAREYLKLGFKLGFGGGITYPRASKTRQLATTLPLASIVLETDAPDMPLHGQQGKRNEPSRVLEVATCLASLREISLSEVAGATTENCRAVFGL